ncbi:MAG: protein translocase subunit SecF [Ruminococcaceae bacterium]|nr:protein translocase subunit SecF [Oscillospiraceae bacterium]
MIEKMKNFSFTGNFKILSVIACAFVLVGLLGLILLPFGVQWFQFDIDFVGGTTMQYELRVPVTSEVTTDVAAIVEEVSGQAASSVTKAGDSGTQVVIKSRELDSETRDAIFDAVKEKYGLEMEDCMKSDYVSASVGKDLRDKAIKASLIAVALILVYITIRFEFRSGIAAIIALVHDLLVMLSMYILFRIPFNMNFIAAALTIFGYSINATIVVFDRIRENKKKEALKNRPFAEVVDISIHQTMSRSLNTTITTLVVMIMLLILGVSSIRNFAAPICVGVIAGCFSSICISGPVWNLLSSKKKKEN